MTIFCILLSSLLFAYFPFSFLANTFLSVDVASIMFFSSFAHLSSLSILHMILFVRIFSFVAVLYIVCIAGAVSDRCLVLPQT